jgi:hypothetical protein
MPLRSDLKNPPGRAWLRFLRDAAIDLRNVLPAGSKLLIVPYWSSSPFGVAVRYNLWQFDRPERQIDVTIGWVDGDLEKVASWAARGDVGYLLLQDGEGTMDEETDRLGLPRLDHELLLYAWRDGRWQRAKSWPIPPELIHRD